MIWLFTVALLAVLSQVSAERFVCYYGSWSIYRHGPGKFRVEDIDPTLCTHLVYAFGGLDYNGQIKVLDAWNDIGDEWHEGAFIKFQKLRKINPGIKLMFAIGGWNEGSEKYSRVMGDADLRRVFVQSTVEFLTNYNFDGLDLDWEYPAFRGGKPSDKQSFSLVVKELAEAFRPYGYLLSAAVSANARNINQSYDCFTISKHLDFINLMTYDLRGGWEKHTGHHTGLFGHITDKPEENYLNVFSAAKAWLGCGVTPSKMNLGVASYGRTFTLADPNDRRIGAPATGPGPAGQFVMEAGFLGFNEICLGIKQNLWEVYYEPTQQVPYAVKSSVWVGFDDPVSIVRKVRLAKQIGFGGIMLWSIETDDFSGNCGLGRNPLMTAVKNTILEIGNWPSEKNNEIWPSKIPEVEPELPVYPSDLPEVVPDAPDFPTIDDNFDYKCKKVGQMFRDPVDYNKFYMCTFKADGNELRALAMRCAHGLVFDESIEGCNFQSADCPLF